VSVLITAVNICYSYMGVPIIDIPQGEQIYTVLLQDSLRCREEKYISVKLNKLRMLINAQLIFKTFYCQTTTVPSLFYDPSCQCSVSSASKEHWPVTIFARCSDIHMLCKWITLCFFLLLDILLCTYMIHALRFGVEIKIWQHCYILCLGFVGTSNLHIAVPLVNVALFLY
jgi:hypothetical protein